MSGGRVVQELVAASWPAAAGAQIALLDCSRLVFGRLDRTERLALGVAIVSLICALACAASGAL